MKKRFKLLLNNINTIFLILTGLIFASCGAKDSHCNFPNQLPYKDQWLGGDVGGSIPLNNEQTLWIFGDTFIDKGNRSSQNNRSDSYFINNTIGISECNSSGVFDIDYYWDKNSSGEPEAFFLNPRADEFYWPLSLIRVEGTVFVSLLRLSYDEDAYLGFVQKGVDLARITNAYDNPSSWTKTYIPLSDDLNVFPATEFIVTQDDLYIYAYRSGSGGLQENLISKIKIEDALNQTDLRSHILYKNTFGDYAPYDSNLSKVILEDGNTEFSIKKSGNNWVLVQMKRNKIAYLDIPDEIVQYKSSSFDGPWNFDTKLFILPETKKSSPVFHKDNFCYAAKLHEGFRISYVCNTFDMELIYKKMDIYIPKFI